MIPEGSNASHPSRVSEVPRVFVKSLSGAAAGVALPLEPREMHHLVHVRRARTGARVEVFDDAGLSAPAQLRLEAEQAAVVLLTDPSARRLARELFVYCAIPKGSRADWMVEKLAELGVAELVPLKTQRSVVDPSTGKLDRLARIAREAAKQSRSPGVLRLAPPSALSEAVIAAAACGRRAAVLTTERRAAPLAEIRADALFIGPEGGWTQRELETMLDAGLPPARLTETVLRVETAAVCAAAVILCKAD